MAAAILASDNNLWLIIIFLFEFGGPDWRVGTAKRVCKGSSFTRNWGNRPLFAMEVTTAASGRRRRLLVFLCVVLFIMADVGAMKKPVHVPDDLEDVVDEEEDEAWREWGKKSKGPKEFDPPPDFDGMDPDQIQRELLKRQFGPLFGFVKLSIDVPRREEDIPEIATRWAKLIRTASMEAKFTGMDLHTIMFNLERGQDAEEFKDFILSQPEAYEVKIGDQLYRRPGDPPLEEVIDRLRKERSQASDEKMKHREDEL